jgi:hypothetical protein
MFNNLYAYKSASTFSNTTGYLQITISIQKKKSPYRIHRIIYKMMTGLEPDEIDHINHIRTDNRWVNLRNSSSTQNKQNKSMHHNNVTKRKGVTFHKLSNKFMARIQVDKKPIYLGLFKTSELAEEAYLIASKKYFDNFHYRN